MHADAQAGAMDRSAWSTVQWGADRMVIRCIDAHTEGEPLRVIVAGMPQPHGATMLERRARARQRLDHLRTSLMWEPRGHADMYGAILTPPVTADADFGVLFLHNEGWSTMCGHGIIAVATVVLETGILPASEPVCMLRIDTPAGLVTANAHVHDGRVSRVSFLNVPSFVLLLDAHADVPAIGSVRFDLAFGGAFYAYVAAADIGLQLRLDNARAIIDAGRVIKQAVAEQHVITHPADAALAFLYGTIFVGPPASTAAHSRNVCVFADGEVDRSPTGTGVSGRLAIHHARGQIAVGEQVIIESIIGSHFTGCIESETRCGPFAAVVPRVEGRAFITGRHEFVIDPRDPFARGFLVR